MHTPFALHVPEQHSAFVAHMLVAALQHTPFTRDRPVQQSTS